MSESPFTLAIHGAGGRMGQRLIALSHRDPELQLQAALEAPGSPLLGRDSGELAGIGRNGIPLAPGLGDRVDVIIDFSVPAAAAQIAEVCATRQIPLVVATTGLEGETRERVLAAAQQTPVLISPSMSLAVNVAMNLVRKAAQVLRAAPDGVDVEVIERHHRFKEDAPSGTALRFGQIVAEEMHQAQHVHGRHGRPGARPRDEIGYHALRVGDNVGEHTIVFGLMGETLEVTVRGHTRDSYAYGALAAAKFLASRKPGLYSMADVLEI